MYDKKKIRSAQNVMDVSFFIVYVDIMFMHCNLHLVILSWLSIFAFKFNQIKLNLNTCWLSHGATISN